MTDARDLDAHARLWDALSDEFAAAHEERLWSHAEITWGVLAHPETALNVLGEVRGLDVVDLGCGAGHLSAWLARAGARIVGALDVSSAQLSAARAQQQRSGPHFPLIRANAEALPLVGQVADLVVSEHGAPAWCQPDLWLAEAARILRPAGRLVFMTNSPVSAMCVPAEGGPAGERLLRGPAELRSIRWPGGGLEHHPSHGDWIAHLREAGLHVQRLLELTAHPGSPPDEYGIADPEWAARWPVEDLWVARKPG